MEGFCSEEFQEDTRIGPIKKVRVSCISCKKTLFEAPVPPWTAEELRQSLVRYVYAKYSNRCPYCRHRIIAVKFRCGTNQRHKFGRKDEYPKSNRCLRCGIPNPYFKSQQRS